MSVLTTGLSFLLALGVLVVVHEFGHYLAARGCGVKVLRFSFGFGKVLWSRQWRGTEWALSAFPLGGYVKMLDARESEQAVPEADWPYEFTRKSVWARILIVIAGPLANFLLAIALYCVLFVSGQRDLRPVLGPVEAQSIAAQVGLKSGDTVLRAADEPVNGWKDLQWQIVQAVVSKTPLRLVIARDTQTLQMELSTSKVSIDDRLPDAATQLGLRPPYPAIPAVVGKVMVDSPAERAGLVADDRIEAIDEAPIADFQQMAAYISKRPDTALTLQIVRQGRQVSLPVTTTHAKDQPQRGQIGVEPKGPFQSLPEQYFVTVRYPLFAALPKAVARTFEESWFNLKAVGAMIIGALSPRNVSGPLSIAEYAAKSLSLGLEQFLLFLGAMSVSLGVLNLLPVPVLDGGHLLYYVAELLRGKPLSEQIMGVGQRIGLSLLGALMLFALFNDVNRLFFRLG